MRQKNARKMRAVENIVASHNMRIRHLERSVRQMEAQSSVTAGYNNKHTDALYRAVTELKREQDRMSRSRERVALLCGVAAVCALLIWLSLKIFGLA